MFSSLLTRIVRFVRNPTSSQGEPQAAQDEAYSKQLLKEMVERKRRNDFVRKREFDILRKMRKREALSGQELGVARPSFFHSSLPSTPDDRAMTLRKIDAIEAQMSMQWWKTNHGALSTGSGVSSSFPASLQMMSPLNEGIQPGSLLDDALPGTYAPTAPAPLASDGDMKPAHAGSLSRPMALDALALAGGGDEGSNPSFTASKLLAVEVAQSVHDPELEEAAIYFSNGEDEQAQACLADALGPHGAKANHLETWLTLFDLYRITGQQEKFEDLALDFVGRFARSAPQWFCMPDQVQSLVQADEAQRGNQSVVDWTCPAQFELQTLAALNAVVAQARMPWRLDWSCLQTIDLNAAEPLRQLFYTWSTRAVQLRFVAQEQLVQALKAVARPGHDQGEQVWWQLLMQVLRVLHRPDDFELVALDFCVNYEVSPPAWTPAVCECKVLDAPHASLAGQTIIGDASYHDPTGRTTDIGMADTIIEGHPQQSPPAFAVCTVDLSGQIQGDALAVLEQLEKKFQGAQTMEVACARLIRVDFSAAGALLNWVAARKAEGRSVVFANVNRLVAAFFNTMGITAHARVTVRGD